MQWLVGDGLVVNAGVSAARVTLRSDATSPAHCHDNCNKVAVMLTGHATCHIAGTCHRLAPAQHASFPPAAAMPFATIEARMRSCC
jgi:hypothetical protein